jgi:hypothetical protein
MLAASLNKQQYDDGQRPPNCMTLNTHKARRAVCGFSADNGHILPFNVIMIDKVTARPVVCWFTVEHHSRTCCRRLMADFRFTVALCVHNEQ